MFAAACPLLQDEEDGGLASMLQQSGGGEDGSDGGLPLGMLERLRLMMAMRGAGPPRPPVRRPPLLPSFDLQGVADLIRSGELPAAAARVALLHAVHAGTQRGVLAPDPSFVLLCHLRRASLACVLASGSAPQPFCRVSAMPAGRARRIICMCGAGISVSAGKPPRCSVGRLFALWAASLLCGPPLRSLGRLIALWARPMLQ